VAAIPVEDLRDLLVGLQRYDEQYVDPEAPGGGKKRSRFLEVIADVNATLITQRQREQQQRASNRAQQMAGRFRRP